MQEPSTFYKNQKATFELVLKKVNSQLTNSSLIRLGLFLLVCFLVYFFFGNSQILLPAVLIGIILFIWLISRHSDLQLKRDLQKELIALNEKELSALARDFHHFESGADYMDPTHYYSHDIDLYGKGSFFQYTNRTATKEGEKAFSELLLANDIQQIEKKQQAIQELSSKPEWRQNFTAVAGLVKVEETSENINKWIRSYKAVFPKFLGYVPSIFSLISLGLIIIASMELINPNIVVYWFFVGLGFTGIYLKKINKLYKNSSRAKDTFKQYHQLLFEIEKLEFNAEVLQQKQHQIRTEKLEASRIFARFSKILDAFDQRNNMFIGILGNGLLLWDLKQAHRIEKWINAYQTKIEKWFEVIAYFDAQNSLANFAFNHPDFNYASISNKKEGIKAKDLGHPLLDPHKRIDNDIHIDDEQFFIITGANMAGKSTFLRTVSLAIVMSNIGLPICAQRMVYSPLKLITSMRTSDSLSDDESYFFSELKRLKFIVEKVANPDEKYFIILDEILKGTNSTDKAIGSKKFVQKLVDSNATGIIATHDLSLCEIEKELDAIKNYYFDAEIVNDELFFDYQLKTGICQNMNASFLLKKMEIV